MNEKTLVKALLAGVAVGSAQLGSGMFLTLRGKRNMKDASKTFTQISKGKTSAETMKTILGVFRKAA